jgi:hypothetical protein
MREGKRRGRKKREGGGRKERRRGTERKVYLESFSEHLVCFIQNKHLDASRGKCSSIYHIWFFIYLYIKNRTK